MSSKQPAATPPTLPVEVELKLTITPEAAATLSRHPALRPLKRARSRKARVVSTYFDTVDHALAREGVSLRLRRDGNRWLQTIKGAATGSAGGLTERTEFEWPVTGAALDPLRFVVTPWRQALAKAERRGLLPRFTTDFERTTLPLTFADSTMALLCIDVGTLRAGTGRDARVEPIHEIELELEAGHAARLFELAQQLAQDLPLAVEPRSKAARGFALLEATSAAPLRAIDADLDGRITAEVALSRILKSCVAQIEGNALGIGQSDDPEWIHQMRIGVRRLRACLSLARKSLPPARVEPLRVELRWLGATLAPARDLDVFISTTLPEFRVAVARGAGNTNLATPLRSLTARAATRRREARIVARAAVASPRFLRLLLACAALASDLRAGIAPDSAEAAQLDAPARAYARPLLKRRHRALQALGADIAHAPPDARHAARLAAKRLRYAAEFFAPLYSKKRARNFRRALAALQEELGAWNDAAVAAQLAAMLAGATSSAAAAFSGWAAARGAARVEMLDQAWQVFVRAPRFWIPR